MQTTDIMDHLQCAPTVTMTITPMNVHLTATMGLVTFPEVFSSVSARGMAAIMDALVITAALAITVALALGPASVVADLATLGAVDSVVAALLGAAEAISRVGVVPAEEGVSRAEVAPAAEVVSRVEVVPAAEVVSRAEAAPVAVADAGKFHRYLKNSNGRQLTLLAVSIYAGTIDENHL